MRRRWSVIGIGIILVALLGLWIEGRRTTTCETCSSKGQPFFQVYSSPTNDRDARINKFKSLASQTYANFRVAVSADEAAFPDVQEFIDKFPTRFVKLPAGYQSQELIYRWIHSVPGSDIIVLFPSEGSLDAGALQHLQTFYEGSAAWLAFQGDVKRWAHDGVLTGYANLFQKIKLQDFLEQGTFSESKNPENRLFELAGRHVRRLRGSFVEGKNYGYSWIARSRKPYLRFNPSENAPAQKTDLVIFSYDRPLQLYALLESIDQFVVNLDRISIIYRVSSPKYEKGYERVKEKFKTTQFFKQGENPSQDFKPLVLKATFDSPNPYVMYAVDDRVVRDNIDLFEGIDQMEKTGAFGVYYRLGTHINQAIPPSIKLKENIYAWQFSAGEGDWGYPNTIDMTLYRKSDIKDLFTNLQYTTPNSLESKWALKRKTSGVGIYYESSKVLNYPATSYSASQLLEKFLEGLKLDIKPLHGYRNDSAHIDVPVSFVSQDETKF